MEADSILSFFSSRIVMDGILLEDFGNSTMTSADA
jgi:hypothetical protein